MKTSDKKKISKKEAYTPEQILQASFVTLQIHGKIFIDELILELKRMYKTN